MRYFIANLKAHKNLAETLQWYDTFFEKATSDEAVKNALQQRALAVVICPSHLFLHPLSQKINNQRAPFSLGAQDVSAFDTGSYTGEVTAAALADIAQFILIGHSERRTFLREDDALLLRKLEQAVHYGLTPVFCVRGINDPIPQEANLIAYEPVEAIGSGTNEDASDVIAVKKQLALPAHSSFLYGGSANGNNITSYLQTGAIEGFLIGTAARDPNEFYQVVSLSCRI